MLRFNIWRGKEKNRRFEEIIDKIKNGDIALKEKFIEDYKPFILNCISKYLNKYIEVENNEEFSIGLIAFNQALDSFDKTKNPHFLSFAELVINRRLKNYVDSQKKSISEFPFTYFEVDEQDKIENKIVENSVVLHFDRFEVREEIFVFNQKLNKFKITLNDLIKKTPKHRDSRQLLIKIARIIADDDVMYKKLENKMCIPAVDVLKRIKVNPKTLERNRKYIIAACIVMRSDLDYIKSFLVNV